jgi:hypothetical protein
VTLKVDSKPPVILKIVPKADFDLYSGENQPMTEKESLKRNYDASLRTIFRISKCFQRSKQKLYKLIFYFTRQPVNHLRRKCWFNLIVLKSIHLVSGYPVPLSFFR